jgi:adenosylhomocysteine nucleosidase
MTENSNQSMTRVAVIAAMPAELKPLVRGWQYEPRNGVDIWRWRYDKGEWIAACAGTGVAAATRAFAAAEKDGPIAYIISAGWAGSLSDSHPPGSVHRVSGVIDSRTGERFRVGAWVKECWLVTSPKVADAPEKQRLAKAYAPAALVDMEAATVARLAAMQAIPFYCLKGVSDAFRDKLPDFNQFISPVGHFQSGRFGLFALLRPWYWPGLVRMGENSKKAANGLAASLLDFLDEKATIRKRNGYPNQ